MKRLFFIMLTFLQALPVAGQGNAVQSRILILLDESSSMIKSWPGGGPKYKAADRLILTIMDSVYAVNPNVEFSLRVFGHQSATADNDCLDTRNEVPFSKDNRTQMALRLDAIRPLGVTPIAYSLTQAAEQDLTDPDRNAYSIILITDGGESCGGDICGVMQDLIRKKVYFKPYIIGLEDDATLPSMYACMGNYLQVTHEDAVSTAVTRIVTAFHPMLVISKADYRQIQVSAAPIPLPVTESAKVEIRPAPVKMALAAPATIRLVPSGKLNPADHLTAPDMRLLEVLPALSKETPVKPAALLVARLPTGSLKTLLHPTPDLAGTGLATIASPALPDRAREDITPIPVAPPVPAKTGESAVYKLATENDRETSLELYFVNAKGTLAMSKPRVILTDHNTGRVERDFNRKIDRLGNIDVQEKIPPGYYDISFPTKHGLVVRNVLFEPKKKDKITVLVKDSKLKFAYADTSRPVTEFKAVVTKLYATPGKERTENQRCNETMEYEPGIYEVRLNTLPKEIDTLDLDFNEDTVITLPQPGYANFTSVELPKNFVEILFLKNGSYRKCYTLDVNDPESKHLRLAPGKYEVHYEKGRKGTVSPVLVVQFEIRANEETGVEIN